MLEIKLFERFFEKKLLARNQTNKHIYYFDNVEK